MFKNHTYNRIAGISLLLTSFLLVGFAQEADIVVSPDGEYTSIQAAIDFAITGDIIEVQSGIYEENVDVNKPITLRGADTGSWKPVVDAKGNGTAITISTNGAVLENFCVINAGKHPNAGIKVTSDNSIISNCNVWNNGHWGVYLNRAKECLVTGCLISNNGNDGILVYRSNKNVLRYNTISNNGDGGIQLLESDQNSLVSNSADINMGSGILLDNSQNNLVRGNAITNNIFGIQLRNSSTEGVGPNLFVNNTQDTRVES